MSLHVFKRGQVWHYRGTVAGRLLRRSTGTANKDLAQRIAAEREAREWRGRLDGPGAVVTFAQAAILYRAAGKPTRFLERVEDYWKDTPVKDINAGNIKQAAIELYPNASPATRNRNVIVPTQAIINHAAEQDLCPTIRVRRFKVTKREKDHATWDWVTAFMAAAGSRRLAALAAFMFLTGARISEALAVEWADVDLTTRRALVRETKIGAERRAHLPAPLMVALANIDGNRGGLVFGFTSRSNCKTQWETAIRRAGIRRLGYHACRHGFATGMLQAGVDPVTIAKLGGWKSPAQVFATYGHPSKDDTLADLLVSGTPEAQADGARIKTPAQSNG